MVKSSIRLDPLKGSERTTMNALSTKVLAAIRSHGMIQPGDRVVAGVSGGPDSVCLLRILHGLAEELQIGELCAVHVNHGLRDIDSDADEIFVRDLAEELGIPFESARRDVAGLAEEKGLSMESAGRLVRYEVFEECRQRRGAQRIAVAHNRNDQAETILMRILRGTGVRGLRGMEPIRKDRVLIRPLLEADREEIEACCAEHGWAFRTDRTNLEPVYTRNRIRLDLIPKIEEEYNPKLRDALIRLGRQAAEADGVLDEAADRFLDSALPDGTVRWSKEERMLIADGFDTLPPAVAKRVFLRCWERLSFGRDFTSAVLEKMYDTALDPGPAEADGTLGRYILKAYGKVWFLRRTAEKQPVGRALEIPASELEAQRIVILPADGTDIVLKIMDRQDMKESPAAPCGGVCAMLDWDKLKASGVPVFRNRRAGDRFRPIGMQGSKKLQDYMVDRKIPRHLRDSLLLLAAGDRILLAGRETGAECAVSEETEYILLVKY